MSRMKKIVALMLVVMVLPMMSGCAEEATGAQPPITPAGQDTPLDVPIDDADPADVEAGNDGTAMQQNGTLELDTTSANPDYSQRLTIRAAVFPSGVPLRWSSSDEAVAALSAESGRSVDVVAVNEGTSTINYIWKLYVTSL